MGKMILIAVYGGGEGREGVGMEWYLCFTDFTVSCLLGRGMKRGVWGVS